MPKNTQIAPRNGTQAMAYAAMLAKTSGNIAAGIAMANELKKYGMIPVAVVLPPVITSA